MSLNSEDSPERYRWFYSAKDALLHNQDMLCTRDAHIAREVKRRLSEITTVKLLVIYGSHTRGRAAKYSDLDLYIELDIKINSALRRKIRDVAC